MSKTRKSAADRESQGMRTGIGGLLLAGLGLGVNASRLVLIGLVVAAIGGIMWGAGMVRRD